MNCWLLITLNFVTTPATAPHRDMLFLYYIIIRRDKHRIKDIIRILYQSSPWRWWRWWCGKQVQSYTYLFCIFLWDTKYYIYNTVHENWKKKKNKTLNSNNYYRCWSLYHFGFLTKFLSNPPVMPFMILSDIFTLN